MNPNGCHSGTAQDRFSTPPERLGLALAAGKTGFWELELNPAARVTFSPDLERVLGWEGGQFDGGLRSFLDRVHPSHRLALLRTVITTIRHQTDLELDFRFLRPGRADLWLLGRGRVECDSNGLPIRLVGVLVDITEHKAAELKALRLNGELEKRVARLTAQLQAASKELEAFCYSVSHDLRAPLRSIRGFSEVLLERYASRLDVRGQEFLRRACESSHHMNDLVESLLKLSRAGRADLSISTVDLSRLAGLIAAELKASDPSRDVTFMIAPALRALGDEQLLRVMLDHLLQNAWKFTAKCPAATIEFGAIEVPEKAFFVRDNGAGFDPAYATKLFGVFQRLHSATEYHGLGVGLATVQRIINRHGGRVWAEAAVNRGATFYFVLPENEAR